MRAGWEADLLGALICQTTLRRWELPYPRAVSTTDLYPASPEGVRRGSEASLSYRLRVAFVLASLALFLALYLGLIAATVWALVALFAGAKEIGFAHVMLGAGAIMLLAFLVKGIFRRAPMDVEGRVRVTEEEQPRLFAFIRRLCADAGSPMPAAVYLSPDVNAAVFYRRSFLSLFLPQRKSLLIGLGLVNALDVSELKAVLAHEFGHFAQSSMKLGQYVYVANQVIRDMVFARDGWDVWLAQWRRIDLRLSFPAWILTALVWLIRKALGLLFKLVNLANLSLSRQMEFNADLHAVSLTGSDALISGLWKTERAGIAMARAEGTMASMIGYGKFTRDVFFHQRAEFGRLDELLAQETEVTPFVRSLRSPYRYGAEMHFEAGDDHAPTMWSTHPSNRDREMNAKRSYVAVEPLRVPAWKLLDRPKALVLRLTQIVYQQRFGRAVSAKDCLPAREVEALAREDAEEQRQAPHYHGFYESRLVDPGDVKALAAEVDALPAEGHGELREAALRWAGEPLAAFMEAVKREEDDERALAAAEGAKETTFTLRGATHKQTQAPRMLGEVRRRLTALREQLSGADAVIFKHFYARTAGDAGAREDLLRRYRFLRAMERHVEKLHEARGIFNQMISVLQAGNQLDEQGFRQLQTNFNEAHARLEQVLEKAEKQRVPKLSHLEEDTKVRAYLLGERLAPAFSGDSLRGEELGEFGRQLGVVLSRLQRLHFKNLGALLRLQETLDPEMYGGARSEEPSEGAGDAQGGGEEEDE